MHGERSCRVIRDDRCSGCSWHGRRLHTEGAPRRRRHADATRNWLCHWRRHRKLGPSADSALAPRSLSAAGPLRLPSPPSPPPRQSIGREEEGEALVLRSPGSPRSTSSLSPSPTPRPQPPPRASVTALPTTLLFSPLFSSPRLASPSLAA